ncbi:MAG: hypothetical protein PGN21_16695 [Sphingomonas paucimobilis]
MSRSWHRRARRRRSATIASAGIAGLVALALSAGWGGAASPPAVETVLRFDGLTRRAAPMMTGVGVHFGLTETFGYEAAPTARAIAALGVTSFRDDLPWQKFKANGLDLPGAVPDRLRSIMTATPVRPLLGFSYGHPAFEKGAAPMNAEGRRRFAAGAGEAAGVLRGNPPIYEIWNEWNLNAKLHAPRMLGAGPPSDPRSATNYVALARPTVDAIRAADPKAVVLVGAAGEDPGWKWVEAIVADGAAARASGLSVHYYNHCLRPEQRTAAEAIGQMEALRRTLVATTGGKPPKVYVTEIGWPTTTGGHCDIPRQVSGDNISQFLLWAAATPWIAGSWVYQLRDQGRDPKDLEHNFGLYDYDYRPKPAACMVADANRIIAQGRAWRVLRTGDGLTLIQMNGSGGRKLIAFAEKQGTTATLRFGGRTVAARPLCQKAPGAPAARVEVGTRPVVIDAGALNGVTLNAAIS